MSKSGIDWKPAKGHFDGRFSTLIGAISSEYQIEIGLLRDEDGVLQCSSLHIYSKSESKVPISPINSRFLQKLGLGELLSSARQDYVAYGEAITEIYEEIRVDELLKNWQSFGSNQIPDIYYAAIAWKYQKFVFEGLDNPTAALTEFLREDRATVSSRIVEARNRGLLSVPKKGSFGGKLTAKGTKTLEKGE